MSVSFDELPNDLRDRIISYSKENDSWSAREMMKGRFKTDINKWGKLIEKFEKRRQEQVRERELAAISDQTNEKSETDFDVAAIKINADKHQKLKDMLTAKLKSAEFKKGTQNIYLYRSDLAEFISTKWKDIKSVKRVFGLSNEKSYKINVSISSLLKLGIVELLFSQKGFKPPSVGVNFIMQDELNYKCSLDSTGKLIVSYELSELFPKEYQVLLNLMTVAYYADLVISKEPKKSIPSKFTDSKIKNGITKHKPSAERIKKLPRSKIPSDQKEIIRETKPRKYSPSASVDPHRRRLPLGHKPSFAKIIEADQFGINLQGSGYPDIQYTFVKGHVRGSDDTNLDYIYKYDYRAVKTFETMLNLFGFT